MHCPDITLISAYLDRELGPSEKTAFETHLQECHNCMRSIEEMRTVKTLFASSDRFQAPYGFAARVMARTARQNGKKPSRHVPVFIRFAEAAVLVVVITVGILAGQLVTNGSPARKALNISSSFSLDLFDATPPGSLGGAYLAITEVGNEK